MSKFLPVGSIVKLDKNAPTAIMVSGFCPVENESGKKFDYSGVIYPEGFNSSLNLFLFNKEDIDLILYEGYSDESNEIMMKKLSEKVADLND